VEDYPVRKGECQETSGFLFSHTCGEVAMRCCEKCNKEICDRHTVRAVQAEYGKEQILCTTCARQSSTVTQGRGPQRTSDRYYDDPYFYTDDHYPNYQMDRDEFTDADEAALRGGIAADELRSFEDDMGAS